MELINTLYLIGKQRNRSRDFYLIINKPKIRIS